MAVKILIPEMTVEFDGLVYSHQDGPQTVSVSVRMQKGKIRPPVIEPLLKTPQTQGIFYNKDDMSPETKARFASVMAQLEEFCTLIGDQDV